MSFEQARESSLKHFNEVQLGLTKLIEKEPTDPREPLALDLKVQMGLFYVHLYAALERSISGATRAALLAIARDNTPQKSYALPFQAIACSNRIRSIKDSSHGTLIENSCLLFQEIDGAIPVKINDTLFANFLQNTWATSIITTLKAFGINYTLDPRSKVAIDEVVDNRNAVAHGRELASTIGERHRTGVLQDRFNTISQISTDVTDRLEHYCVEKRYLRI